MKAAARELLQCPFCTGKIRTVDIWEGSEQSIRYGLLQCGTCRFEYPIIASVALILGPDEFVDIKAETTSHTLLGGPQVRDLVRLLKAGDRIRALSLLLGPTSEKGNLFPELREPTPSAATASGLKRAHAQPINREIRIRRGGRLLRAAQSFYRRRALPKAQLRLAQFLETHREHLSALDAIDLFYRQYSGVETANYFAFRFGQPRHLAALSLATLLNRTRGPILDLACGLGHLTHTFAGAHPGRPVIGLDRDFFRLYVASQFVAPDASYLCAPADQPLPFPERTLGAIFCSDAFHYFLQRSATVREFRRLLTEDGILILSRFGNGEVEPREGYELSLEGYRALFDGFPCVFFGEDELIDRYLAKRGPNPSVEAPVETLRAQKWLSLVASSSPAQHKPEEHFHAWPHAIGRLQLNPIYLAETEETDGGANLRFEFPSSWYEFENARYLDYAPRQCRVEGKVLQAIREGKTSPALEHHLDRFVILGMPERYVTSGARDRAGG